MGIYIPGLSHSLGVNVFSYAMRNSWQNQFIGRGSDGRKLLILWEKYGYQFPRLSPQDGFCCILPCYGKLAPRPMHFTYEEIPELFPLYQFRWSKAPFALCQVFHPRYSYHPNPTPFRQILHFRVRLSTY